MGHPESIPVFGLHPPSRKVEAAGNCIHHLVERLAMVILDVEAVDFNNHKGKRNIIENAMSYILQDDSIWIVCIYIHIYIYIL